jgi:hypothetical protein
VVLPFGVGEAAGGHGAPLGLVPAVLGVVPGLLPGFGVEGDEPGLGVLGFVDPGLVDPGVVELGFDEPGFDEPGFDELGFDDPVFGVEPFGSPGITQGVPLGLVPGLLGVADPGMAPGVVALGGVPVGTPEPG